MRRPNYQFEKRQKDLQKQRKKEEKKKKKLERKGLLPNSPDDGANVGANSTERPGSD